MNGWGWEQLRDGEAFRAAEVVANGGDAWWSKRPRGWRAKLIGTCRSSGRRRRCSSSSSARRYELGPMILTSNQSLGSWGDLFGDRVIASAILDPASRDGDQHPGRFVSAEGQVDFSQSLLVPNAKRQPRPETTSWTLTRSSAVLEPKPRPHPHERGRRKGRSRRRRSSRRPDPAPTRVTNPTSNWPD